MKAVFRADASLHIGTGHVMRCLTLADALAERGAVCHFICREHPGHLIEFIRSKGHAVHALPMGTATEVDAASDTASPPAHAPWLGATQAQDAAACATLLSDLQADWRSLCARRPLGIGPQAALPQPDGD